MVPEAASVVLGKGRSFRTQVATGGITDGDIIPRPLCLGTVQYEAEECLGDLEDIKLFSLGSF